MRIVSYNIHYFSNNSKGIWSGRKPQREIADALFGLSPPADIVCLQEMERKSLRAFRTVCQEKAQMDTFMDAWREAFSSRGLPFPYEGYYFPAHTYRLKKVVLYTTGLAIFVHTASLRVLNKTAQPHVLTVTRPRHPLLHHLKQTRICAHLLLEEVRTEKKLHIYNTHLSLPSPLTKGYWLSKQKMGFGQNQILEARRLLNYVKKTKGPTPSIVCGDFNSRPNSPVYEMLVARGGLADVRVLLNEGGEVFATAGFMRLRLHLDHIFSSGEIEWKDMAGTCGFGDLSSPFHGLSDHIPLIAQFELKV
ncbi:MAG: endonuclease/exonuclease/phosphatase family protein [Proteobacteria bacterium]|nr:endonuclease/exonuclease/phosphatase family protein [Cystobacterineae bacterium]MCL2313696.1 endonuclease/exonuclease/phosphatase family protein [Pseudomonadota bacterium]